MKQHKLPETEAEYRAFLAARVTDPETAAQDAALLAEYENIPCRRHKRASRPPDVPAEGRDAIRAAERGPGWNSRSREVHRFDVPGDYGRGCLLLVVPYRRFAYYRQEQATAAHGREHGAHGGNAA